MPVVLFDPVQLTPQRLRPAVAGDDPDVPRGLAMSLLRSSSLPDRHRDLQAVLEDEQEPFTIRHLAADNLRRLNTPAARDVLARNVGISDQRVLAGVLAALGHVGDEDALDAILAAMPRTEGRARRRAAFAATLLAYRFRRDGHDLPEPAEEDLLQLGTTEVEPVRLRPARPAEVRQCQKGLGNDPVGITVAAAPIYQVRVASVNMLVAVNEQFAAPDAFNDLRRRKALLGVVLEHDHVTLSYVPALLMFATPAAEAVLLHVCDFEGEVLYSGRVTGEGSSGRFRLRALVTPGALPIHTEGTLAGTEVDLTTAVFAPTQMRKLTVTTPLVQR